MNRRLEALAIAVTFFGAAFYGFIIALQGDFGSETLTRALLWFMPLVCVLLLRAEPVWLGIGLGGSLITASVPLRMLQRMEIGMLILILLLALVTLRGLTAAPGRRVLNGWECVLFMLCSLWVLARFAYDRPGSASTGGTGGLGEASILTIGIVAYFTMARIAAGGWDARRNTAWAAAFATIGLAAFCVAAFSGEDGAIGFLFLFSRQSWLLCSLGLAWAIQRYRAKGASAGRLALVGGVIALVLLLGVLAPHRSRPIYAMGMISAVVYAYGYLRRLLLVMVVTLGSLGVVLFYVGPEKVPLLAVRSLSTVLPVSRDKVEDYVVRYGASSESGWELGFRAEMNRLAWYDIQRHPWFGRGFTFTKADLNWALARSGTISDASKGLAFSGAYHNTVLELAVFCGLPAAIFFALSLLITFVRFAGLVLRVRDPHRKLFAAALLAYGVAATGQLLVNGDARDFFYVCVVLGVMRGFWVSELAPAPDLAESAGLNGASPARGNA